MKAIIRKRILFICIMGIILGGFTLNPVKASAGTGFQVNGTKLYDGKGNEFVMRGVNYPHAWYTSQYKTAIPAIANKGFNSVRIVLSNGNIYQKTSKSEVEALINICKENKMVAILEVHDATGKDEFSYLNNSVSYWKEIQSVLIGNEDYVILNIANEWFGTWYDGISWKNGYISAINSLRDAGIKNTLMVDCAGWGQHPDVIFDYGKEVLQADRLGNTMFSIHMYEYAGGNASVVRSNIDNVLNKNLCLVIGEFGQYHTDGDVDEDTIMSYCQEKNVGWLAWSWTGNGDGSDGKTDYSYLNLSNDMAGNSLSDFGNRIISGKDGIRDTANRCTIFNGSDEEDNDASYTVKVFQQNLAGNGYEEISSQALGGKVGQTVNGAYNGNVTGLTLNESLSVKTGQVSKDNSLVLSLYYDRNVYEVAYELNGGKNNSGNPSTFVFGETISLKEPEKAERQFAGWFTDAALTKGIKEISSAYAQDLKLYAGWEGEMPEVPIGQGIYEYDEKTSTLTIKMSSSAEEVILYLAVYDNKDTAETNRKQAEEALPGIELPNHIGCKMQKQEGVYTYSTTVEKGKYIVVGFNEIGGSGITGYYTVEVKEGIQGGGNENPDSDKKTNLFYGNAYTDNWGQAVSITTVKNGGSCNLSSMLQDGYIWAEYSGTYDGIELIFQSWNGEPDWLRIAPSQTGTSSSGNYYAKFYYQDIVNVSGTNFDTIDVIHIGARANGVTVYSVDLWTSEGTTLDEDVEVGYTVETYLENLDGTFEKHVETKKAQAGEISYTVESIQGFTFDEKAADNVLTATLVAGQNDAVKLKAYYVRNNYAIKYELNGGKNDSENLDSYKYGTEVKLKNPSKKGNQFTGWFTDAALTQEIKEISSTQIGDLKLYAGWKEKTTGTPKKVENVAADYTDGVVTVTWEASEGAEDYQVSRFDPVSGKYTTLCYRTDGTSYADQGVEPGVEYRYRITAWCRGENNEVLNAEISDAAMVSVECRTETPAKVENVSAVYADGAVTVTWDASEGATDYMISRFDAKSGCYTALAYRTKGTTFVDDQVEKGILYRYRITAWSRGEDGKTLEAPLSDAAVAGVDMNTEAPAKVQNVKAVYVDGEVTVSWEASEGADCYTVNRYDTETKQYTALTYSAGKDGYKDSSVKEGVIYTYRITAWSYGEDGTILNADISDAATVNLGTKGILEKITSLFGA